MPVGFCFLFLLLLPVAVLSAPVAPLRLRAVAVL